MFRGGQNAAPFVMTTEDNKRRGIMLEKQKMDRINELARASNTRELKENEKAEQKALRTEYLEKFRESFRAQLDKIEVVDKDETMQDKHKN